MWTFKLPTILTFGEGVWERVGGTAREYGRRPLVVTDENLAGIASIGRLIDSIRATDVFAQVESNPTVANVDALTERIRETEADVLVAIGGGSPMDCAKAASCLAKTDKSSIRAFHSSGEKFGAERIPVIAVPTTAGTGSEVTPFAVLDDRVNGVKAPIASNAFYPVAALIDPTLTHSLPVPVTTATGLDALTHAIEGYWSKNHQPVCDLLAVEAGRRIFANLNTALTQPDNGPARSAMSYAALLAGAAFQLPKNAMVHACSFPLSRRYHLPHGVACAFTLELAIRENAPHMDGRMEQYANACGFAAIDEMIERIGQLKRLGALPITLADAGIAPEDIDAIVEESFHPLMNNNPKRITREDLKRMYHSLA